MAETLFRQWFVEEADEDWEEGCLGDVIELFDHLRIPLSKMERDKKKNIDEIITGAVQPKINQGNLKALDFPKFPEHLVKEFNEQTESFFKKINQSQTQIRTLEKLRDTLLPKLMSGEVRVRYNEKEDCSHEK